MVNANTSNKGSSH